jgi:phosphoglycolate phosphatase-like HAD superfamily hydrolase
MLHVLVDIDETMLSVPKGINAKASSMMFRKVFGIEAHEEMIDNVGKTEMGIIQEILQKVGLKNDIPDEAYKVWGQATADELRVHHPKVLDGIPELLTELSNNKQIKLGLLTGNSTARTEAKLKAAHLDSFFRDPKTLQLIGVFGEMAPKRDQLFDLIKGQSSTNDRFVIIDDSLIAAQMAKKHNIPIILVTTGKATIDQLRPYSSHVFTDFGEDRWKKAVLLIAKM